MVGAVATTMKPLILLSPAKTLNFESELSPALAKATPTQPRMLERTRELTAVAAALSQTELQKLMKLSDSLARLNYERFKAFETLPERIALGTFEGQAYKYLDAHTLGDHEISYLQSSLRILSGLYGLLRPLDQMRAYRLEMGTKLRVGETPSLYKYWGSHLTQALNAEIAERGDVSFVLNVASKEYASAVQLNDLSVRVVTACFPGPAVHAKTARGLLTRFCAREGVSTPEELHGFDGLSGEWSFDPSASSDARFTFLRDGSKMKKCRRRMAILPDDATEDTREAARRLEAQRTAQGVTETDAMAEAVAEAVAQGVAEGVVEAVAQGVTCYDEEEEDGEWESCGGVTDGWEAPLRCGAAGDLELSPFAGEESWLAEWRRRFGCWWLGVPPPMQAQLGECLGALAIHLGSRFEMAWRVAQRSIRTSYAFPKPVAAAAEARCEWVERTEAILQMPEMPDFTEGIEFRVPPIPRLVPNLQQLQALAEGPTHALMGRTERRAPTVSDEMGSQEQIRLQHRRNLVSLSAGACVGIAAGALLFFSVFGLGRCGGQVRRRRSAR